jgi:hypothetical protein
MITPEEYLFILEQCMNLPPAEGVYLEDDYIVNLFLTVLDFRLKSNLVKRAIGHYRAKHWEELRTFSDLKNLLQKYQDNNAESTEAALYLWGYRYWTRLSLLRKLMDYFGSIHVLTQQELMKWARESDYERDFKGRIPGMAFAVYQWLVMRQGVETVKPDVHLKRFVTGIVNHSVTDEEIVATLENIARELTLKTYELDWKMWEYQKRSLISQ